MWMTGKHFFNGTPDPVEGKLTIPGAPGLGFTPNYEALAASRITDPRQNLLEGRDSHGYLLRETINARN
jgi:L-rhamnonate dehydratase